MNLGIHELEVISVIRLENQKGRDFIRYDGEVTSKSIRELMADKIICMDLINHYKDVDFLMKLSEEVKDLSEEKKEIIREIYHYASKHCNKLVTICPNEESKKAINYDFMKHNIYQHAKAFTKEERQSIDSFIFD